MASVIRITLTPAPEPPAASQPDDATSRDPSAGIDPLASGKRTQRIDAQPTH